MNGLGRTALVAVPAAVVATTAAAGLATALGVDFELPDGGEPVPPFLAGGDAGTTASLVVLHLVAAAVMVPALTRGLETVVTDLLDQRV